MRGGVEIRGPLAEGMALNTGNNWTGTPTTTQMANYPNCMMNNTTAQYPRAQ